MSNIIWNIGRFKINLTVVDIDTTKYTLEDIIPEELRNCKEWRITNEEGNNLGTISASWERRKIKNFYEIKKKVQEKYEKIMND